VTGRPSHSSQVFREDVGAGAVFEAARILHRFYDELSTEPNLSFNPGAIVGGTEVARDNVRPAAPRSENNVVAAHAAVTGDLRTLSPSSRPSQDEDAHRGRPPAAHHGGLTFTDSYPPSRLPKGTGGSRSSTR
jgi:glutamate carboxypeptidase